MKTYNTPSIADLGDVRTLTAAIGDQTQTDQIIVNGRVTSTQNGSLDLCATEDQQDCLGA